MKKHNTKVCFEDWYLRIVDAQGEKTLCCTVRLNKIGTNMQGSLKGTLNIADEEKQFEVTVTDASADSKSLKFGQNVLNNERVVLDLQKVSPAINGCLELNQVIDLNQSFLQPGAMGFYKYLPFMEFYQEVIVLNGVTTGVLQIDGKEVDFTGGNCYLQRQWGSKFPNIWLWAQCTNFDQPNDLTIMIGVARLKVLFNYYTAFVIPVYYNDQLEVFSNYNGGQIAKLYRYKGYVHLIVTQKNKVLDVKIYGRDELECVSSKESHGIRDVYECDQVKIEVKISEQGNILWEGTSLGAHIEMGGNTSKLK